MKIYTKTGDLGETGLLGGLRVLKSSPVIEVTGLLDETNCLLGVAISENGSRATVRGEVIEVIEKIQHDLFDLGSRVAAYLSESSRAADFSIEQSEQLERWIDDFDGRLPALTAFILPGGSFVGSLLHQARAMCRRAERAMVALITDDRGSENKADGDNRLASELIYLNRLSDLLFVLARFVNTQAECPEIQWQANRGKN
jgi:cob(I)alamin adenosyltransferase